MTRCPNVRAAILLFLIAGTASADPVVPGFTVTVYANIDGPVRLSFDPSGILYTGRETILNVSSEDFVGRIGIGGSPVSDYGTTKTPDPDAVLFDATGVVSGIPGSVLVAGFNASGGVGQISRIQPDQSVSTLFSGASLDNPTQMTFDQGGRLLIATYSDPHGAVLVSSGGFPTPLFTLPVGPLGVAVDSNNRIFTSSGSTIRIHDAAGNLINGSFATVPNASSLAIGTGGVFGNDLYTHNADSLYRVDALGGTTLIGTGFDTLSGIAFGPDGALYVSEHLNDRILRIDSAAVPEPGSLVLCGLGAASLLSYAWRRRNRAE